MGKFNRHSEGPSEIRLRWEVSRCRRKSDTRTQYLLELARAVADAPRSDNPPPLLEIGTRSGGSALLMLRILKLVYPAGKRPLVLTVDPYGTRPYEGAPFVYDDRHYLAMKHALASHPNHIHYMMDSELFLKLLDQLYLWIDGARRPITSFSVVYLDGSHDPDLVWGEIERLMPMVIPGGYLIVDDTDWFEGAVRMRLDAAAGRLGGRLRHNGKQSILQVAPT